MRIIALIQANVPNASLLLRPLDGKPILKHVIDRLKTVKLLHEIAVITSHSIKHKAVQGYCEREGLFVYAGRELDSLDSYYHAAHALQAQAVLNVRGNCPLIDPAVVTRLIKSFQTNRWHHAALNAGGRFLLYDKPKYPAGMEAELTQFESLRDIWRTARSQFDRHCVGSYFWRNPADYDLGVIVPEEDYSHLNLAVEQQQDYPLIKMIYQQLSVPGRSISLKDVANFFDRHADLLKFNLDRRKSRPLESGLHA